MRNAHIYLHPVKIITKDYGAILDVTYRIGVTVSVDGRVPEQRDAYSFADYCGEERLPNLGHFASATERDQWLAKTLQLEASFRRGDPIERSSDMNPHGLI